MDSFPPLPQLLEEIIDRTEKHPALDSIKDLTLKLELDSDLSLRIYQKLKLQLADVWGNESHKSPLLEANKILVKVLLVLRELLKVPKREQLSQKDNNLKRNDIVAGFMSFLLQLMKYYRPTCDPDSGAIVTEKLRYLLAVLGDTSIFEAAEREQVENLLDGFEQVANKTGSMLHLAFNDQIDAIAAASSRALSERIDHLNENITNLLKSLPSSVEGISYGADSVFIVETLLSDLEAVMNSDDTIRPVKDQIKVLHQWLILSKSLIHRGIKLPQHLEMKELNGLMMQITSTAHEVEYLINYFLVGDAWLQGRQQWVAEPKGGNPLRLLATLPHDYLRNPSKPIPTNLPDPSRIRGIETAYLTLRLSNVIDKLKLTVPRLQEIAKDYNVGVLKIAKDSGGVQLSPHGKNDHSLLNDVIIGFEEKEIEILDQLTGGTNNLQIVFISGMAGLGKTTLARKIYNNGLVREHFGRRSAWCVISQTPVKKNLWIDILIGLKGEAIKDSIFNMSEERLAQQVFQSLKGWRYLIVMDDLWYSDVWDEIQRFFPKDPKGSRILFTSRNKSIAPSGSIIHELPFLSNNQCWELLQKKVFNNRTCPPQQSIGKKIAANCTGLPLAVVVIAGALSTLDEKESAWENVADSVASFIFSDQGNKVMHILELSYIYLPQRLKPCFLYFALFPEDTQILVKKLTQYWVAEGFIYMEENMRAESIAEGYLMELVDKSLVIVAKRNSLGGVKFCMIHDLVHELCSRISEKDNFLKLIDHRGCSILNHKYRRLCFDKYYPSSSFIPYGSCIRSLIGNPRYVRHSHNLGMNLLRLLDYESIDTLDDLVGEHAMVHLRYLNTEMIPEPCIDKMLNLEFLILHRLRMPFYISSYIMKMVKLKYLHVNSSVFDENSDFCQTSNLEYLSCIHLFDEDQVKKLKYFPHLHRLKCVVYVYALDLLFLDMLESLAIIVIEDVRGTENPATSLPRTLFVPIWKLNRKPCQQLVEVQFPSGIKKLTLDGFLISQDKMSTIGALPSLQVLKLRMSEFEGGIWETRDDEFEKLRVLKLKGCKFSKWNVSSSEHFSILQQLFLMGCGDLLELPVEIGEIDTLKLIEVHGHCHKSLLNSVVSIQELQQDMGNEDLVVDTGDAYPWGDEEAKDGDEEQNDNNDIE